MNVLNTKRRVLVMGKDGRLRKPKGDRVSWRSIARDLLRKQFGDSCHWCGRKMLFGGSSNCDRFATIEHLKRQCDGGTDAHENLRLACRKCNNTRHN